MHPSKKPPKSSPAHLVKLNLMIMREMKCGEEKVHKFTLQASFVEVLGDNLADEVLASACPAVQREGQGLLRVRVVDEASQGFQDHFFGQVLPKEFGVQTEPER